MIKRIGVSMIRVGKTLSKAADDRSMVLFRQGVKTGLPPLTQPT